MSGAKPDMDNYFETPIGQSNKLVIGGKSCIDGVDYTASELRNALSSGVSHGIWDYNDLATSTTPISLSGGVPALVENDGLGSFTNTEYGIEGVNIYDPITNSFLFNDLELGSTVGIRLDIEITTNFNNEQLNAYIKLGSGAGEYTIPWLSDIQYKSSGVHRVVLFNKIYMGDLNTRDNPAQFYVEVDGTGSLKVNGWFIEVSAR